MDSNQTQKQAPGKSVPFLISAAMGGLASLANIPSMPAPMNAPWLGLQRPRVQGFLRPRGYVNERRRAKREAQAHIRKFNLSRGKHEKLSVKPRDISASLNVIMTMNKGRAK